MGWPYEFPALTKEEKHLRRQTISQYALIAHLSALAPPLIFLAVRLAARLRPNAAAVADDTRGEYHEVPRSPVVKARRASLPGRIEARWRRLVWWMADDVYVLGVSCGQRDQWLLGTAWTLWLLALCFIGTGRDYFHLTKRFGAVAVSQFPVQYAMSLKSISPLAWVFRSSHEQINRYHRVLGRVVYGLLLTHMILYNTYFFIAHIWLSRVFEPVVLYGVVASLGLHMLNATALARVRDYSYRLFFVVHLLTVLCVPVLIFFHAPSVRIYLVESVLLFIGDLAYRKFTTVNAPTVVETVPGTNLLKISASAPAEKMAEFQSHPGAHVYLNIPPPARFTKSTVFDFLYNPFTVAATGDDGAITLVARHRKGPMTDYLNSLASQDVPTGESKFRLGIEGPYGSVGKHFDDLIAFGAQRVLLIAGGVGGTFALPVYHALRGSPSASVQLIWAIRSAADATWAVSPNDDGQSIIDDPHVQLFVTGSMDGTAVAPGSQGVELGAVSRDSRRGHDPTSVYKSRRPDLKRIVDDTFSLGQDETVAVLVCGPAGMARDARQRVRPWVMKGRKVWWHNEHYGW